MYNFRFHFDDLQLKLSLNEGWWSIVGTRVIKMPEFMMEICIALNSFPCLACPRQQPLHASVIIRERRKGKKADETIVNSCVYQKPSQCSVAASQENNPTSQGLR